MPKSSISPTGRSTTYYSTTAILNLDAEQTLISQMIMGMSLASGRPFTFDLVFDVTNPGLISPTLTIKIKYGNQVGIVVNNVSVNASILSGASRRFRIKGSIVSISDDNNIQMLDAEVRQDASLSILGLGGIKPFFQDFSLNSSIDQMFSVTAQLSSLLSNPTVIMRKAIIGMP